MQQNTASTEAAVARAQPFWLESRALKAMLLMSPVMRPPLRKPVYLLVELFQNALRVIWRDCDFFSGLIGPSASNGVRPEGVGP